MRIRRSCSWCHEENSWAAEPGRLTGRFRQPPPMLCRNCGHRADVARMDCDCSECSKGKAAEQALRQKGTIK